jgi:hypothetical protein
MTFSGRSKSTALRNWHCLSCDPKRDLFYQFSCRRVSTQPRPEADFIFLRRTRSPCELFRDLCPCRAGARTDPGVSRKAGKAGLSLLHSHTRKSSTRRAGHVSTGQKVTPWKRRPAAAAGARAAPSGGCVMWSRSAARPKCNSSAAATKQRSRLSSNNDPIPASIDPHFSLDEHHSWVYE